MNNPPLSIAAVLTAGLGAACLSCTGAQDGPGPAVVSDQGSQENVKTDHVTFHVIGMKKTASGAT